MTMTTYRNTKYCDAIQHAISDKGHATNNEILAVLRNEYPEVSATTVHRATARLAARGDIGIAPPDNHGSIRYDALAEPHDHFNCSQCDRLCDATIRAKILPIIEETVKDCSISGNIVITGICKNCAD